MLAQSVVTLISPKTEIPKKLVRHSSRNMRIFCRLYSTDFYITWRCEEVQKSPVKTKAASRPDFNERRQLEKTTTDRSPKKSADPCWPGARRLRVSNTVRFPTINNHRSCFQLSVKLLSRLKNVVIYRQLPSSFGSVARPKNHQFSCLFPGQQNPEKLRPRLPKHDKHKPRNR